MWCRREEEEEVGRDQWEGEAVQEPLMGQRNAPQPARRRRRKEEGR